MHEVSIVIPVYNAMPYLRQCLDTVTSQTLDSLQIICVNDGSTDESLDVIREYAACDSRFQVIDKANGGYGSAMNVGLSAADGLYVGLVEPDDFVSPRMFENLFALAKRSGYPDIVKSSYDAFTDGRADYETQNLFAGCQMETPCEPNRFFSALCLHPSIWSALYRLDFLKDNDILFQEIPGAGWADNLFFYKTMFFASSMVATGDSYYRYRKPAGGGATALKDCELPFRRMNDIFDFLEEQGERQLFFASACRRAFHYLNDVLASPYYRADDRRLFDLMAYTLRRVPEELLYTPLFTCEERALYHMILDSSERRGSVDFPAGAAGAVNGSKMGTVSAGAAFGAPLFSFVVPVKNNALTLGPCLHALGVQFGADYEVICVDGGSTDASLRIQNEAELRDGRFRAVGTFGAVGTRALMVRGAAEATGTYVVFVHPASKLDSSFLFEMANACTENDLELCRCDYFDVAQLDENRMHLLKRRVSYVRSHYEIPFAPAFNQLSFHAVSPFVFGTAIRRDLLQMSLGSGEASSPFESNGLLSDVLFKALALSERAMCVSECLYYRSTAERDACLGVGDPSLPLAEYAALEAWLKEDACLWEALREPYLVCLITACMERIDVCPVHEKRDFAHRLSATLSRLVMREGVPVDHLNEADRNLVGDLCAEPDALLAERYPAVFDAASSVSRGSAAALRARAARAMRRTVSFGQKQSS